LVEDDGPGFGERKSDPGKSLGYKLIGSLLGQHHGSFTVLQGPGGRVLVRLE
jgi:hypothetical protein